MRFGVLGPVEVRSDDDRELPVSAPILRLLLGALVSRANEVVGVDTLVDVLWAGRTVSNPRQKLQVHIHRLRQLLGDPDRITRLGVGYVLAAGPGELDAVRFEALLDHGRIFAEGNDWDRCAGVVRQALELWRGQPYGELAGDPLIRPEAERLTELRLAGFEELFAAELARGRHSALIAELREVADQHPLRERLQEFRMLALYRAGRQAEALEAYRRTRDFLAEELGVDPAASLTALQTAILSADPSLEPEAISETPAQLPPAVADFTGREEELNRLTTALTAQPRTPAVAAIAGPPGIGKTALAVRAAHQLIDHYPDGQLYVDLRGADDGALEPGEALARLLRALGVAGAAIPESTAERSSLFRSKLAGTRMLILLDNAADEQQVRPLLPGRPGCAVLVTSRIRLVGLEGAGLVDLDLFTPAQALGLLTRVVGERRLAGASEAAAEIVRLCDQLPLAVRIAAARLAGRPDWAVSRLADRLADERHRLDELSVGDLAVRASLALGYHGLEARAQTAFGRLGLLAAPNFATWVVAAVIDGSPGEADRLLDQLVDARLLEPIGPDRYRFHDLVRLYAREIALTVESEADRSASTARALQGWLERAGRASRALDPDSTWLTSVARSDALADSSAKHRDPLAWFDAEHGSLVAAVAQAVREDRPAIACGLADAMDLFMDVRGYFDDWRRTHETGLRAARRLGCHRSEAVMLSKLARLDLIHDHYESAWELLEQADRAFDRAGDELGRATVQYQFGTAYRSLGEPQDARNVLTDALTRFSRLGDAGGIAKCRQEIGATYLDEQRGAEAKRSLEPTLAIFRALGDRRSEALTLRWLGAAERWENRPDAALAALRQSAVIFEELGDPHNLAYLHGDLGRLRLDQGRLAEADSLVARSLAGFRTHGDRHGQARALHDLGKVHQARENLPKAVTCLRGAAQIWSELGISLWHLRSLRALEQTYRAVGDLAAARATAAEIALFEEKTSDTA